MRIPGYEALKAELTKQLDRLRQVEVARLAGTTVQHVNDVARGRRAANDKLTEYLGFELRLVPTRKRSSPASSDSARSEHLEAGA